MSDLVQIYYKDGNIHRKTGPAITAVFSDCIVEQWFDQGYRHRNYKRTQIQPAFIKEYSRSGEVEYKYYFNGEKVHEIDYIDYGQLALKVAVDKFPDKDVKKIIYDYSNVPEKYVPKEVKEILNFYKNSNEYKLSLIQNI